MEIKRISIKDLKPSEYNPRKDLKPSDAEYKKIKKSIKEFGYIDPLVVNSDMTVIGGHQRLKVLEELGYKEIDCVIVDLKKSKEKALNIALNKIQGDWDYLKLKDLLLEIDTGEFDIDITGFDEEEIAELLGQDIEIEEDGFDAQCEYEKIVEPKTKNGDLWVLGNHRLFCGDATIIVNVEKLMNEEKANLIFTDPPYNVGYDYDWRAPLHKGKKVAHRFFSDKKSDQEYCSFICEVFKNAYLASTNDANFYCWFATKHHSIVESGIKEAGWHISQVLIWLKNYPVLSSGQDFHRTFEPCLHGWKKNEKHFFNRIGNYRDVVNWDEFELLLDIWYEKRDSITGYEHPTQKPIRLAERALRKSSRIGDVVLDFFGGSGSTLIACEQLNRKCYMMEIDPIYSDVIVKRWERYTGKKAELTKE